LSTACAFSGVVPGFFEPDVVERLPLPFITSYYVIFAAILDPTSFFFISELLVMFVITMFYNKFDLFGVTLDGVLVALCMVGDFDAGLVLLSIF
jgi:hypothetical protein